MAGIGGKNLERALDLYDEAISQLSAKKKYKKGEDTLEQLDTWYQKDLPELVSGRKPHALNCDELAIIMKWKLKRGKFRPKLQSLVESNPPDLVAKCSMAAFKQLPNVKKAIETLTELKGVGPATASAILSSSAPCDVPFMADEAVESVLGEHKISYTVRGYMDFVEEIKKMTIKLNEEKGNKFWTPHKLELALWSHVQCDKLGIMSSEGRPGKQRTQYVCNDSKSSKKLPSTADAGDSDEDDPPQAKQLKVSR